jgi:hypothetical protein
MNTEFYVQVLEGLKKRISQVTPRFGEMQFVLFV